ncbi:uncharacterized protein LOC131853151 [Achroia grisella]|uniref:uncharacterized protein LOC131853151 n=1 Tax=Achroia grisella TaxID=688607 RepID=UPI0027D31D09|nr:uncharacterized protein LOC131853151 [Achroia grisella]
MVAAVVTVALIAAFTAAAGGGRVAAPRERLRRVGRSSIVAVETDQEGGAAGAAGAGGAATEAGGADEVDVAQMAEMAEIAEMAEVPAWRDLWYGSLDALHVLREPTINNTQEDVLAQLGAVAFLHCPVRNLGERGVSWVRRRDWHIISSGVLMYTNDERFQVLHSEGSDDWILQIKYVQKRDNGTYECQVSTGSGTLSRLVHLHIAVPEAFILINYARGVTVVNLAGPKTQCKGDKMAATLSRNTNAARARSASAAGAALRLLAAALAVALRS